MTVPAWLVTGYYIDAKDTVNDWCVAQVIDINTSSNTVEINFDGWGNRRNSVFQLTSSKLAPFRSHSQGYTGPKRYSTRSWEFSREETEDIISCLESLLQSDLKCASAFETTQFYRGRLFYYTEILVAHNYGKSEEDINLALECFSLTIKVFVKWLKAAPTLFPAFYRGAGSLAYLEDNDVALATVWYEVLHTLNTLFALDRRVNQFFVTYNNAPRGYEQCPLTLFPHPTSAGSLAYLINLFSKEGGFEAILQILQVQSADSRVPFGFINCLMVYALSDFLEADFASAYFKEFTDSIFSRVEMISDEECKNLRYEEIVHMLDKMASAYVDDTELELNKVSLFLKMMRCPYLEKRIKGLAEINNLVESLEYAEFHATEIRPDLIKNWIFNSGIIEMILTDRPHLELLKRSGTILKYLARHGALTEDHLDMLWRCAQGKHESFVRAAYIMIVEITSLLDLQGLGFIFSKFLEIPYSEYDAYLLQVIKEFTSKALDAEEPNLSDDLYGACILKAMMKNEEKPELSNIATKYFGEILVRHQCPRKGEIHELIQNISENKHVPQSLKLLSCLLYTSPSPRDS